MTTDLDDFAKQYQGYHRISERRRTQQMRVLREFRASLGGRELAEATTDDLQSWAGGLLDRGYHPNTVRKQLNMVRPFYSWAYAAGRVTAEQYMALRQVKNPRGSTGVTRPRPYTRKELDAFWAQLDHAMPLLPKHGRGSQAIQRWLVGKGKWGKVWRHAMRLQIDAMVRLALDCGLRRHEIFGLSLNDLHYDNEYLVINGKADPHTGEKKIRSVPITDAARQAIKAWVEFRALMRPSHDSPWLSCWADVSTKPMWETRFSSLLRDVVGDGWTWHRFRHTCATEWLRAGAELEIVSTLLGHSTLQQTRGYAELLKTDVARELGKVEGEFSKATAGPRRAA